MEMTSDIPYRDQPMKMFIYLDGYHFAVKNGYGNSSGLLLTGRNPRLQPINIYEEGLRDGANDSEFIPNQVKEKNRSAIAAIQSKLENFVDLDKKKKLIINQLTERLAAQERTLNPKN